MLCGEFLKHAKELRCWTATKPRQESLQKKTKDKTKIEVHSRLFSSFLVILNRLNCIEGGSPTFQEAQKISRDKFLDSRL